MIVLQAQAIREILEPLSLLMSKKTTIVENNTTIVALVLFQTKIEEEKLSALGGITKSVGTALDRLGHRQNTRIEEEMRGLAQEDVSLT